MDITTLIEELPESVKSDTIDFTQVKLKTGCYAVRVTLDRLLTDPEKATLSREGCIGVDCVARYRYAPEIQKSYFYIGMEHHA